MIRNLKMGLFLLLFVPLRADEFKPGMRHFCIGLLLSLGIVAGFDYSQLTGEIVFYDQGAAVLGSLFFLLILLTLMVGGMRKDVTPLPLVLTIIFSALPWYLVIVYLFRDYSGQLAEVNALWVLLCAWALLGLVRAIRLAWPDTRFREYSLVSIIAIAFVVLAWNRYIYPTLFYAYDPEIYDQLGELDQEDTWYRQSALVAEKIGLLKPERPGQTDTYFVGFAGNGEQQVFPKEVSFIRNLMDQRFGTRGRSINLINDVEQLASEPLANRHNLKDALRAIGHIMDPQNDILFLYLTSHGDRDATLQVALYPFQLQALSATDLAVSLDEAGIEWRVIVISACYSGSFIDALANEKTLILTSAAADKTSFGCSNESEFTYFGEALFAEQLSLGGDLVAAFDAAKVSLLERERDEGIEPSDPQISIGSLMQEKLLRDWPRNGRNQVKKGSGPFSGKGT